jgi:hypothetical protein
MSAFAGCGHQLTDAISWNVPTADIILFDDAIGSQEN